MAGVVLASLVPLVSCFGERDGEGEMSRGGERGKDGYGERGRGIGIL